MAGTTRAQPLLPQIVSGNAAPATLMESDLEDFPHVAPQFDTTSVPLPPNVASLGYHITATSELGDYVRLAGAAHFIDSVTFTMSSWAIQSDYPGSSTLGFTHPITLKLYEVDRRNPRPQPGAVIASVTTPFLIPWRPEPDPAGAGSPLRPWRGRDGNFYGGMAFNVTFDLSSRALSLPDEVIFSISFNTQNHGAKPLGVPGPYDSLSVGVSPLPPLAGADMSPGAVYWKTADGKFYGDGGAGGVNVFRTDVGLGRFKPAVRFNNSSYGTLAELTTQLMDATSRDPDVMEGLKQTRILMAAALDRSLWDGNALLHPGWGGLVFQLLAESADELAYISNSGDPIAGQAQRSANAILSVAQLLAESALGDAIIGGANADHLGRAQQAFESARTRALYVEMIDDYGETWREAYAAIN
jgi:hypothetical protein